MADSKIYIELGDNLTKTLLLIINTAEQGKVAEAVQQSLGLDVTAIARAQMEKEIAERELFLSQKNITWLP